MSLSNTPLEDMLEKSTPEPLSAQERGRVWDNVEKRMHTSVPSPYFHLFVSHKSMIPLVILVAVLLAGGGTVAASDAARPGDLLFGVDRAVEDVRLSLSNADTKADLKAKFASERLREFESIVDEEIGDTTLTSTLTEAEADVFTNETIVKLEAGDKKVYFSTDADTRAEIIAVIVDNYGYTEAEVDAVLTIETEDRESRDEDRGLSEEGRARLEHALTVLNSFMQDTLNSASTTPAVLSALAVIESRLQERADGLPSEFRAKVRDDKARFEIRNGEEKVRVEIKDGEVRIKSDDDDEDDDRDDDSRSSDDDEDEDKDDDSSQSGLEIEADVFTDTTIVKVENNDTKSTFSTSAKTRTAIIAEVLTRYPLLTTTQIDAALELEIEDRASRADDSEDDSDEDEDDDSGKDDEDSKDDDSSGTGSGRN